MYWYRQGLHRRSMRLQNWIGGGGWLRSFLLLRAVHKVFQFLARLEVRYSLGWHFHSSACFRIPAHSGLPLAGTKTAETANLDLVSRAKSAHDAVEDCLHDDFGVLARHFD